MAEEKKDTPIVLWNPSLPNNWVKEAFIDAATRKDQYLCAWDLAGPNSGYSVELDKQTGEYRRVDLAREARAAAYDAKEHLKIDFTSGEPIGYEALRRRLA